MFERALSIFNNIQGYFLSGVADHSMEVQKKMKYLCTAAIFSFVILIFVFYGHSMMGDPCLLVGDALVLLTGVLALTFLKKGRPAAAGYSIFIIILTFVAHNVYGDFVFDGTRKLERLFETITFCVIVLLMLNVVALNRKQLIYFTILSALTIVAHAWVLVIRFYDGVLPMYAIGITGTGLVVISVTCFITNLSFTMHRGLLGEVEELNAGLEDKVAQRTKELIEKHENLVSAKDALLEEMQLAKKIQTELLPRQPSIDGYEISAYMQPADEVGGDYYDIINVGGKDWLVIGDVSGHGVSAGLVMMMVQTSIHSILKQFPDMSPTDLLGTVNPVISRNIKLLGEDKYMTITVLACHENGEFYFSGLHQDIMIYRDVSKKVDRVATNGMWIGVVDEINDLIKVDRTNMNTNDVMLLFTDGITEAMIDKGVETRTDSGADMFTGIRLSRVFETLGRRQPGDIQQGILNELAGYTCHDDVTMVIIKRVN